MESIIARIGDFVKHRKDLLWRLFVFALISWSAYNLGLVHARNGVKPAQEAALFQSRTSVVSQTPGNGTGEGSRVTKSADHSDPRVVVSKSSASKKYHFAWCSSGQRIKEPNRVWYPTEAAAQAAGYTLAGNCTK